MERYIMNSSDVFHLFVSPILFTNFSQFEQLKKKKLLVQNSFIFQFVS